MRADHLKKLRKKQVVDISDRGDRRRKLTMSARSKENDQRPRDAAGRILIRSASP